MTEEPHRDPVFGLSDQSALLLAVLMVVVFIIGGSAVYLLVVQAHIIPVSYALVFRVVLAAGFGILAVVLAGRVVLGAAGRFASPRHVRILFTVYRLIAYVLLALLLLYVAGINGVALLAGGTFAGLVLGLASQTALANLIAGILLLLTRPFAPGDRITIVTWQYGLLMPAYPPKFYSQDFVIPGYTGLVEDLGLFYTAMRMDDGAPIKLPNSIVIQAAVLSHDLPNRWVRLKYEIPPRVDPARLLPRLAEAVRADEWVVRPESVRVLVNQATVASYVVSVDALCRGAQEEEPRSALYLKVMGIVREMAEAVALPAPGASPPSAPGPVAPAAGPSKREGPGAPA